MNTPTRATRARPSRSPAVARLQCPSCHSPQLSVLERVTATAGCHSVEERADGSLQCNLSGWTDVDWTQIVAVGLRCDDCGHSDRHGGLQDAAQRFARRQLPVGSR